MTHRLGRWMVVGGVARAMMAWVIVVGIHATLMLAGSGCAPPVPSVRTDIVFDTDDIDILLDRYTDSHKDPGCAMRLLISNEDTYEGFLEVIDSAESTLHIATLFFDNDHGLIADMAMEFIELLIARVADGIKVRVILDGFTQELLGRPNTARTLREGGVEVLEFAPPINRNSAYYMFHRAHKKMLIADGRRAVIGGSNFGTRYMAPDHWRDTDVLLDGPVVTTIQRDFLRDWHVMGGLTIPEAGVLPELEPAGELEIRMVEQRPAERVFNINTAILIALRMAERYVVIESPYFNPTDWLIDELIAASGRGVEIVLLTNGETSMDVGAVYPVVSSWFPTLLNHGMRVFLWGRANNTMHSKILVVDDKLAMIGSHNFNGRSILWDTENAIIVTDPAAVAEVHLMVQDDLDVPHVYEIDHEWIRTNNIGSRNPLSVPVLLGIHF